MDFKRKRRTRRMKRPTKVKKRVSFVHHSCPMFFLFGDKLDEFKDVAGGQLVRRDGGDGVDLDAVGLVLDARDLGGEHGVELLVRETCGGRDKGGDGALARGPHALRLVVAQESAL